MAKKPWRVVEPGGDAGRFTAGQILAAVEAVKARNEAESENRHRAKAKRKGAASRARNGIAAAGHDPDTV
jgi:hypothetical protein